MITTTELQSERNERHIWRRMEALIPAVLWDQYLYLSLGEMAEVPELAEYAGELRAAEKAWFTGEPEACE